MDEMDGMQTARMLRRNYPEKNSGIRFLQQTVCIRRLWRGSVCLSGEAGEGGRAATDFFQMPCQTGASVGGLYDDQSGAADGKTFSRRNSLF